MINYVNFQFNSEDLESLMRRQMNSKTLFMLLVLIVSGLHAINAKAEQKPLVFIVNSFQSKAVIQARYQPLIDYLQQHINHPIVLDIPRTYQHGLDMLKNGDADIAELGPSPFIRLKQHAPNAVNILATMESNDQSYFHGVIVVRKDASYSTIGQLQNAAFAFGSPLSTLSFFYPAYMLLEQGIGPQQLKSYTYLQQHDIVAEHVIMGRQDAGGIKDSVAQKYQKYLRVIATTPAIKGHAIVVNSAMSSKLQSALRQALIEIKAPQILHNIRPSLSGFTNADNTAYKEIERIMQRVETEYPNER